MATKSIAWNTGSGNITLTYQGHGDGTISVQTDANDGAARSQIITIQTTNGSPIVTKTVTISQAAMPNLPYVDLGLPSGTLWAKGNIVIDGGGYAIGAETDRGCFFSWGNIVGHEPDGSYSFSSTNYNATPGVSLRAAIPSNDAQHDAALACLGEPWHLATTADYQELIANTDSEWVSDFNGSGVNGYKFMKKTNHSVYIFMPASGWQQGSASSEYNVRGEYFASNYYSNTVATNMTFKSSELNSSYTNSSYGAMRRHGKPVRAVCKL